MKGICCIVGAGDFSPHLLPKIAEDDLLIAADAGYKALADAGVEPDVFVGDGDSLGYIPEDGEKEILPCEKDDTDTHAAIKLGFERGYRRFEIFGALGGERLSHSVANVRCLFYIAERGGEGVIRDEKCELRLIFAGGSYRFSGEDGYFSLFSCEGDAVVSISGAKYELKREKLPYSGTLGVSNEPRGDCAVTVHEGKVLLIREGI